MFPSDLDGRKHPLATRRWGMFLGTLIMVAVAASLVSPRTIPYSAPVLFLAAAAAAYFDRPWHRFRYRPGATAMLLAAFLFLALMSSLWSLRPSDSLEAVAVAAAYAAAGFMLAAVLLSERRRNTYHIAEGYWIGLLAGLVYLLVEIITDQSIKIFFYNLVGAVPGQLRPPILFKWAGNRVIAISPLDLTRNISPITLFLWPALLSIKGTTTRLFGRVLAIVLLVLSAIVVFASVHETSKVALMAGALVFTIGYWNRAHGLRVLQVLWVTVCLTPIPMSIGLYRLGLQEATWLQLSAQARIVIWNTTAEAALTSPIYGLGANSMYAMAGTPVPDHARKSPKWHPHAHNIYLQTWFELGAIGAAILTLFGLALLDKIKRMPQPLAPYAQATFASAITVAGASYGMWQVWFVAMFVLAGAFLIFGLRANVRSDILRASGLTYANTNGHPAPELTARAEPGASDPTRASSNSL